MIRFVPLLVMLVGTGASGLAQDAAEPAPTAAAPPPVQAAAVAKPKMICRTMEVTGSRLGGKRVCMTAQDWRQREADDQCWLRETSRARSIPN